MAGHGSGMLAGIPEHQHGAPCTTQSGASIEPLSDTDSDASNSLEPDEEAAKLNGTDPVELDGWGMSALQAVGYVLGNFEAGSTSGISIRHVTRRADMKCFAGKDATGAPPAVAAAIRAEYELLRSFTHPSIVAVEHLFTTRYDIWLLREWCFDGCAWSYVSKHGAFEEQHGLSLIDQLVEGLFFLHQKGLMHRNLEPSNLLLTDKAGKLKVAGFSKMAVLSGLAQGTEELDAPAAARKRLQELTFINAAWASPEHIQGLREDSRSDIWSCGLCAGFLIVGRHPFTSPADTSTASGQCPRRMCSKRLSVALFDGVSVGAKSFVKLCLQLNPAKRPWCMELRLHPVLMTSRQNRSGDLSSDAIRKFRSKTSGSLSALIDPVSNSFKAHTMDVLPTMCGNLEAEDPVASERVSKNVAIMQDQLRAKSQFTSLTLEHLPAFSGLQPVQMTVPSYSTLDTLPPVDGYLDKTRAGQDETRASASSGQRNEPSHRVNSAGYLQ